MFDKIRAALLRLPKLFVVVVVVPTAFSIIYFGLWASDVYVSESRFVVRSPDKQSPGGLGILLKTAGFSNAGEEIFAAQGFVESRDGLRAINVGNAFQKAVDNENVSILQRFDPLGLDGSFEDLYQYYREKVSVDHNPASSITTLTVRSFDAQTARRFNEQLLSLAEATVNRMNMRGRQDLIRFAEAEVADAQAKAARASVELARFRNKAGVVDPERQATVQLQMIAKLQDELIATKSQLLQVRSFAAKNPQVPVLEVRIKSLNSEINDLLSGVAGDQKSLSSRAVEYQRLQVASQFADRQVASAMASLEEARNEARRKQAYVERIVEPNLPDTAQEPRRWRSVLATLILGVVVWAILSLLLAGVKEHWD